MATGSNPSQPVQRRGLTSRLAAAARRAAGAWRRLGDRRCPGPRPVDPYVPATQPVPIVREDIDLRDEARGISMTCIIVRPEHPNGAMPVVLYSMPMDWSPRQPSPWNEHVARHLAAHGYAAVHIRHTDSNRFMFPMPINEAPDRLAYIKAVCDDPASGGNRCLDAIFVLDWLEGCNSVAEGPRFDLDRLGIAGHSYGSDTALTLAGHRLSPCHEAHTDPRVKAFVGYSIRPTWRRNDTDHLLRCPALYISGTEDHSFVDDMPASSRLWLYHSNPARSQYALMLRSGDHHTVGGGRPNPNRREQLSHQWIRCASLAFWDTWLRDDAAARSWLDKDFGQLLKGDGRLLRK